MMKRTIRLSPCLALLLLTGLVPGAARAAENPLFAGREPLVPIRVAMVSPCTRFGKRFSPELYDRTVKELPSLGFNGVLVILATTHGTAAGRDLLPEILGDAERTKAWSQVFDRVEALGLDVYLTYSPLVPPGFSPEQVKQHYAGRRKLEGLPAAIRAATEAQANALYTALPQVDGLVLHSLELEEIWGRDVVSPYPAQDVPAAEQALGAYLDGLQAAGKKHQKKTYDLRAQQNCFEEGDFMPDTSRETSVRSKLKPWLSPARG
jgi:hypothetical protein